MLSPEAKEALRARIADRLADMEPMFDTRCKLTFVMRAPHVADGDLVVTNDNVPLVVKALERLQTYDPVVSPGASDYAREEFERDRFGTAGPLASERGEARPPEPETTPPDEGARLTPDDYRFLRGIVRRKETFPIPHAGLTGVIERTLNTLRFLNALAEPALAAPAAPPETQPHDQSDDSGLVAAITSIVRDADQVFEKSGGTSRHWVRETSRHWVRDQFLPMLNARGFRIMDDLAGKEIRLAAPAVGEAPPQRSLRDTGPNGENVATSLIVANLRDEDIDRFHAAKITYSGSTGKGAIRGYEPYGPYIATYLCELPSVLKALRWEHVALEMPHTSGGSAIAHRRLAAGEAQPEERPQIRLLTCSVCGRQIDGDICGYRCPLESQTIAERGDTAHYRVYELLRTEPLTPAAPGRRAPAPERP